MDTAHMFIYRGRMTITIYIFENSPCYIRHILSIIFYIHFQLYFSVQHKKKLYHGIKFSNLSLCIAYLFIVINKIQKSIVNTHMVIYNVSDNQDELVQWCMACGGVWLAAATMAPGSIRTGYQRIYIRTCFGVRDRRLLPGHDPLSGVRAHR